MIHIRCYFSSPGERKRNKKQKEKEKKKKKLKEIKGKRKGKKPETRRISKLWKVERNVGQARNVKRYSILFYF